MLHDNHDINISVICEQFHIWWYAPNDIYYNSSFMNYDINKNFTGIVLPIWVKKSRVFFIQTFYIQESANLPKNLFWLVIEIIKHILSIFISLFDRMESFVNWILGLPPTLVQVVSYTIVFFWAIIEWIPPLGFLYPCWLILCIAGFLANIGLISLPVTIVLAILGAIVGEVLAFKLWEKYGMAFFKKTSKFLPISDAVFEKVQAVTKKNFILGIFFSKIYGRLRGFIPFMSGISKLNFIKFIVFCVLSCAVWGIGFTLLVYVVGESYTIIVDKVWTFFLRWGIIAGIIAFCFWIAKSKYNIFTKNFTFISLTSIFSILCLGYLTQQYVNNIPLFVSIDLNILAWLNDFEWLTSLSHFFVSFFNFQTIWILWIILIFYLYHKKLFYYLSVFFSSSISCLFAFPLIKIWVTKPLDQNYYSILNDYGYPSWYAMTSIVMCLLIRYCFQSRIKNKVLYYGSWVLSLVLWIGIWLSTIQNHLYKCTDIIWWFLLWIFIFTANIIIWKIIFQKHKNQKKVIELSSRKRLLDLLIE